MKFYRVIPTYSEIVIYFFVLDNKSLCPITTRSKVNYFELVLRDVTLVQSPVEQELLASVWDHCYPSIMKNFDSYNW